MGASMYGLPAGEDFKFLITVEKSDEGNLSLHLDGGAALTFYDSAEHYESYQIQRGEKTYVI
jgi:hypothetical protein